MRFGVVVLFACTALRAGVFVGASNGGWVPDQVGMWSTYTGALPNNQLPDVPLLGNGALGVLLDAHAASTGRVRPDTGLCAPLTTSVKNKFLLALSNAC